jgi:hypothetical protein
MQDFSQIVLVRHNLVNILVGTWDFVKHAFVFPTDNTGCLLYQIILGKALFGGSSTHTTTGAMGTRTKTFWMTFASNNVTASAHTAGYDSYIADSRSNGPFTCYPNVGTIVVFFGNIVVMTIHYLCSNFEGRQMTR